MINPFLVEYGTYKDTTPFDKIKTEHYEEAMLKGIAEHKKEIDDIVDSKDKSTFKNVIERFALSGELLGRVQRVAGNLLSAETSEELQELVRKMTPLISQHSNDITLNEKLFQKIKKVYDNKENESLNIEEAKLLEDIYEGFVRAGANLPEEKREEYKQLKEKVSLLELQFSENILKAINKYHLHITNKEDLKGLPQGIVDMAKEEAEEKKLEGWIFTLQAPSYIPFMTYADNRDLRRELYLAYNTKCASDNEYNNEDIVKQIVNIRRRIAELLGYEDYAQYKLQTRMAKDSRSVYKLINELLEAYMPTARKEYDELRSFAKAEVTEGIEADFELMPWDWAYYSNKLKEEKFSLNDEMLRPYFELNNVINGVFGLATRLYGITFKKNDEIAKYHKDVDTYDVYDADGKHLSVLYTDFHPRSSKRGGAWMTEYKGQWIDTTTKENSRPHISIVMNFTKPTAEKPSLLTFDEVVTFLHEFGHALHGMFADTTYESLSGTNVYRDFVELPSQIMENFATEREFLNTFAKHYITGENIPDEYIKRIVDSANFNVGYACIRQLSFGLIDMAWHSINTEFKGDVKDFEKEATKKTQLLPSVDGCCMSTQFSHIFDGGYSAGYYSYKWAEVLDADAFDLFKEKGVFNTDVANSFRENILSKGGTEHPMELYKRFRGSEPSINALLKRNGIA